MTWIWKEKNWPKFTWDNESLVKKSSKTTYQLGILRGKISGSGNSTLSETQLEAFVSEVISTSKIEGEILERKSVRSSIARRLGLEDYGFTNFDRKAEGIIEILSDATKNYDQKLNLERLFSWHAGLFPKGYSGISKIKSGELRGEGPMRVVSGEFTDQIKVHFEAPPKEKIKNEMKLFLDWFNNEKVINSMDGLIRAAIAKFWFVTIHPFDDGNGRISRTISDMALAQSEGNPNRIISLSSSFLEDISSYYNILEKSQRGDLDISEWIEWYINHLNKSISHTEIMIDSIVKKSKFWIKFKDVNINDRQRKVINKLLDLYPKIFDGGMTNKKYASMTKSSNITAARDLSDLLKKGLLLKGESGGRSTYYLINIEGLNKDIK